MFLIALDKYFLNTLSASYTIDETDKTIFVSPIVPLFGQTFNLTDKSILNSTINTHSYNMGNLNITLPSALASNQLRILSTAGHALADKLFETLYPLTGAIQKIYVTNAALSASFTNVKLAPYSSQNRVIVELSLDGEVWTSQGITFSSWQPHETKELYIRVKLNNTQVSYDAIGIAITYQSATGKIDYGYVLYSFPSINPYSSAGIDLSMFYAIALTGKNVVITGTSLIVHNLASDTVTWYNNVGSSTSKYFNLSPQKNYLFFSNKIYRTNDMASIITLSDVSDKGWAAGFTPDEQYFVYSSTSGLKVIRLPSGELVKVHNSINLHNLQRSAALYPTSPDEIWLFGVERYEKFEAGKPFDTSFLAGASQFLAQYWLDNSTFAVISKATYSGLLVNTNNMLVTPFKYATSNGYDANNLNLIKTSSLLAIHSFISNPSSGYHRGDARILTPSTGVLNEWNFYPENAASTKYITSIIDGYIYGVDTLYYNKFYYKRFF